MRSYSAVGIAQDRLEGCQLFPKCQELVDFFVIALHLGHGDNGDYMSALYTPMIKVYQACLAKCARITWLTAHGHKIMPIIRERNLDLDPRG